MDTNPAALCPGCFQSKGRANPCPHCGFDETAPRPVQALPLGTLLHDQFVVGRVLGKPGGFGITYLAWDRLLEAIVAIKEYLPRELVVRAQDSCSLHPHSTDENDLFRYGLEQFLAEARTLAKLDHPNLVRVRQFFEANGTAYLVMDYYQGCSLAEHLERQSGGRMSESDALALMQPILDGLRAVHAKGFLHRDIKPQNIYLAQTDSGSVRPILLDFGAARQAMGERSRSLSVVISPGYAPFEQYHRKGQQGPATDIYAAAAVLYRMLSGVAPPEATERMAGDDLRPAVEFGVSTSVSAALEHALAMSMEARPDSVAAFQQVLQPSVLRGEDEMPNMPGSGQGQGQEQSDKDDLKIPPRRPPAESDKAPARSRLPLIGVGLLIGAMVGGLIAISVTPSTPPRSVPETTASPPVPEPVLTPESKPVMSSTDQQETIKQPELSPPPAAVPEDVAVAKPQLLPATEAEGNTEIDQGESSLVPAEEREDLTETKPQLPPVTEAEENTEIEPPMEEDQRYRDNGDGTVTDLTTGLQWMRCSLGQEWTGTTCAGSVKTMTWHSIMSYGYQKTWPEFASHSDWRVPKIEELKTLVYCSSGQPTYWQAEGCKGNFTRPTVYTNALPNTPSNLYWSASPDVDNTDLAWGVSFGYGEVYKYGVKGRYYAVRLVRSGMSPPLMTVDAELLATCRKHLKDMHYTHPEHQNALLCYQVVQRQDPDNTEAAEALEKMTAFYLKSGQRALRDGEDERVRDRIERLKRIDPNSPAAAQLEQANADAEKKSLPRLGQRYQDNGDGTVTDLTTGLHWMRCSLGQEWTVETCLGTADEMTWNSIMPNGQQKVWPEFAGHRDWRVPTMEELKTIVYWYRAPLRKRFSSIPTRDELMSLKYCSDGQSDDHCDFGHRATIYSDAFPNTPANVFWAANPSESDWVCVVNFINGQNGCDNRTSYHRRVRLVRNGH